jgi:hypothetical protein
LNDVRRAGNPDLILSFLESHPDLFPQKTVIETLETGIAACKAEIRQIEQHNQITSNPIKATGPAVLEKIKAYVVKNNLQEHFPDLG